MGTGWCLSFVSLSEAGKGEEGILITQKKQTVWEAGSHNKYLWNSMTPLIIYPEEFKKISENRSE